MDKELELLLSLGVVELSVEEEGQVISPVFLVKKTDNSHRLILNLKKFNEIVQYEHFKMENLSSATAMMTPGCFMASVDLRHAYYSVPIKSSFRKFLKFRWRGQLYQYTCFANRLSNCPRYFTKLLKPIYSNLRSRGFLSAAYLDDSYLQGQTFEDCATNIQETVKLFQALGFVIHHEKSVLTPSHKVKYLGFWLDSEKMTVTLPAERAQRLYTACQDLKMRKQVTIRLLAQVIGQIVAAFPAVLWGPLFYRDLEANKSHALKSCKGNFEAVTLINREAESELDWWIANVHCSFYPLTKSDPDIELSTDASSSGGWGAACLSESAGGRWSVAEQGQHINVLELLAVEYALKSFEGLIKGKHVKVLSDNSCAVAYLTHMGGSQSPQCNRVTKRIWLWAKQRQIWITVSHIPGKLNVHADSLSRTFNDRTEWTIDRAIFRLITDKLCLPEIDLFASRLNFQLKPFVSWGPDPEAWAVDAFTLDWSQWVIYAFPPFSLLHKTLCKWQRDKAEGLLIAPLWTTAPWYPLLLRLLVKEPLLLPKGPHVLHLPHSDQLHPLHRHLQLMACRLSGKPCRQKVFRDKLSTSCSLPGEIPLNSSMHLTSLGGLFSVANGVKIPFMLLYL